MVAVATSSALENAECVMKRLGLSEAVQAVASSCMTERSKPAPDIFLLAMRLLGVDGGDCLVIEDADSGVKAARAAGVKKVIGIRHPGGWQTLDGAIWSWIRWAAIYRTIAARHDGITIMHRVGRIAPLYFLAPSCIMGRGLI